MRIVAIALAAVLLCVPSVEAQKNAVDMSAMGDLALSSDGALVAVYTKGASTLHVLSLRSKVVLLFSLTPSLLGRFMESPELQSAEWSPDGKCLKIVLYDGDEDYVVVTVNAGDGLASLWAVETDGRKAGTASWSPSGHTLYAAPLDWDAGGVYAVDPVTHAARRLAVVRVAGNIAVGTRRLVMRVGGPDSGYSLAALDLDSGQIQRLQPRK